MGAPPIVCVATVRRSRYSETFIRAHVERLPTPVRVLHGDDFPLFVDDDRRLLSLPERGANSILRRAGVPPPTLIETHALARHLQRTGVAAVLAEYGTVGARVAAGCQRAGVPLIVHFHGFDAYRRDILQAYGAAYRRMFRTAAGIVAVSHDMEQRLRSLDAAPERLFYNPCGADTELFRDAQPAEAGPVFVTVGRFTAKKAPHLLLRAFEAVRAACPGARLVMVGNGPLLDSSRRLAGELSIGDAVRVAGPMPHADVAVLMRTARALVQHSVRAPDGDCEGTPVTLLEAGAAGLPVVATRHGGIPDVVLEGHTGFLVDEGDVHGMAASMLRLARDPALASAMGRQAQRFVRGNHSLDARIQRLWGLIERAIAGAP